MCPLSLCWSMSTLYWIALALAWKPDQMGGFCSHIRMAILARFLYGAKPWKWSITIEHHNRICDTLVQCEWVFAGPWWKWINRSEDWKSSTEMEVNIQEWGLGFSLANPIRVNSDKRHGLKSSDSAWNEIATRDNLPRPNWDSDGKADNKQQAVINTDTKRFKIQSGDMGHPSPPGRASTMFDVCERLSLFLCHWCPCYTG